MFQAQSEDKQQHMEFLTMLVASKRFVYECKQKDYVFKLMLSVFYLEVNLGAKQWVYAICDELNSWTLIRENVEAAVQA